MANNNFFLFEDTFEESQESKSIESAKKYLIGIGYDEKAADEYVRVELRNNFPALRDKKTAKFILGMTRISIEELEVLTPSNMVELNNILKLITEGHYNEYDRNLNGLTGGKLFKRFSSVKANNAEEDKKTLSGKKYQKSEYKIIPINSFEEAQKYSNYTDWCITNNKNMFDTYTNNGINQFYFCLKNGFENVPKEKGENCPLDDYGLSMLAVCVDEHGYLYTCTSRWNHDCGSDDSVMNVLQVSDVIGESFYNVFKPNNNFTDTINSIEKRLQNGENPEEIFDIVGDFINGVANVVVGNKANWITSDGKIFYPEMWFDTTDPFFNGFAVVSLKHSWNFMRIDRKLCNKHIWLDSIESVFNKNGLAIVKYNDKLCYYKTNGRLIPKRCDLDFIGKFGINNLAMASGIIDGVRKFNFIDLDGKLISPKLWFDFVDTFEDGFAPVEINDKYNYINSEGEYLTPDRWYDDAWQFEDGLGEVSYNDEWWNIDTKGQLIKNPSLNESIKQDLNKARKNTDKTPSEAQKKSGNYKKGHININGFRISLENPKGSYRKGVDSNGREWKTKMKNDYGYFLNTVGYDNDHIDVFLGNKIDSKKIFVIDQRINGKFDESKVMLWFNTEDEAKKAYLSNYEKNWKGFYKITEVDEELFKTWLYDGKKQRKPFYQYKAIKDYNKKMNIKENFIREVIKEAIARVSIHEANENTLLTNKLIKVLYKIASKYTSKIYTDDAWEGVHTLMDNLRSVNGVESLDYGGGRYHSISKNIGEGTYKAYNIKIMTAFNTTISGELRCHFSGTNDDPWSRYDMSISLWRQNEEPNMFESKNTLTESKGLHSQKLYNLISAHGGFAKGVHNFYLNSLTDSDVIGELSEVELSSLHDAYPRDLIAWAKNKGYEVDKGDNVELLPLKDYTWIAVIERGYLLPDKEYIKTSVGALKDKRNRNKTKLDGAKNYRWQDTNKWGSERQNKFQSYKH